MRSYVLTISPDVFIWTINGAGLVYNSSNFKFIKFSVDDKLQSVCEILNDPSELYKIVLDESELQNETFSSWIQNLVKIGAAFLEPFSDKYKVSLKPILKIQYDKSKILAHNDSTYVLECLRDVTIHLSDSILSESEEGCYKQFIYPRKSSSADINRCLKFEYVQKMLQNIPDKNSIRINLVGEIFSYPFLKDLLSCLRGRSNPIAFYHKYAKSSLNIDLFRQLDSFDNIIYLDIQELFKSDIPEINVKSLRLRFIVQSLEDVSRLQEIASMIDNDMEYELVPFYNGFNLDFIRDFLSIDISMLSRSHIVKRHVFMNQVLNSNFFGKLELYTDGAIYSNPNFPKLGNIENEFSDVLLRAFNNNSAWFLTRNVDPCNECVFKWLCPPQSNYELNTGVANLCKNTDC